MNAPQIPSPPFQIPEDQDMLLLHPTNGAFAVEGRRATAEGFTPAIIQHICSDTSARTGLPFARHIDTARYEQ